MSKFSFARAVLDVKAREINNRLRKLGGPAQHAREVAMRDELLDAIAILAAYKEKAA